ncbi:MAG: hypothetical protein AB7Q27_07330 [Acidimicrobiia bacterium]
MPQALPEGFAPTLIQETGGRWTMFFARSADPGDLFDAPLRVVGSSADQYGLSQRPDVRWAQVAARDLAVVPLRSDGETYGTVAIWQPTPQLWVAVEAASPQLWVAVEAASPPLSETDALDIAAALQPVEPAEWDRLRQALSIDSHVGVADPDATPVTVIERPLAGGPYVLTAHVPAGYPLGAEDRRLACYSLSYRGDSSPILCDQHPWWLRIGGQLFVFGPAQPGTTSLQIKPAQGLPGPPIPTSTANLSAGPPGSFYAEPIPDDYCWVDITRTDNLPDPALGPIGPLPNNPEHPTCIQTITPNLSTPSTVAR